MDADTWGTIVKAFGELTLTGFLFANWWLERSERMKIQARFDAHLEGDIEHLLDETETIRRETKGTGI
jgi:hypothetical protein